MKDDVARGRFHFKPGLTPDQLVHYEELQAQHEDLRDQHIGASEFERACVIEPELKRIEAELGWIQLDLLYFGGWLQDNQQPSRRGRPVDPKITWRDKRIAAHSLLLELEKIPSKIAIASITELYHVPRSTVFTARQRWCSRLREFGYHKASLRKRRSWRKTLEWNCQNWRFQSK
jgi:hypothetical protein